MWQLTEFKPEHAKSIIERNIEAQSDWLGDGETVADLIAEYSGAFSFTMLVDGIPVACAGVAIGKWNIGNAWALLSADFKKHKIKVFRAMKHGLATCIAEHRLNRVQAFVDHNNQDAVEFIEVLGFEREGLMKKSGPNGLDFLMYARIK